MIRVQGLVKAFGGQPVLRGVDLAVQRGMLTAVIGPSGSGKTVLLKHLIGLVRPDAGRIRIDGQDVAALDREGLDRLRARFGVVFQGGALFDSMSCLDNVAFPLREKLGLARAEAEARARQALDQVGLEAAAAKFPAELSGGMRKRASIARALVAEPDIVFFDEPTTGLDPILVDAIHRLILELHRARRFTGVIVSHELPEIFDVADAVTMLHEGRVILAGTPVDFLASEHPIVRQMVRGDRAQYP